MPVDPKRVETIFNAALEVPPTDRPALLAAACADDAELRARVEQLLAAHTELEAPPVSRTHTPERGTATFGDAAAMGDQAPDPLATEDHSPRPDIGTVIAGKYKLIEEIGEGGMGTVWMAQQTEPVKRFVALKLIKAGMDSRAVLARFEAERQALALMDHPNIAKVLDAGATADGRPFFVMELVKGVPITKFCDAKKLTPRERLELFVPVCQAIQHAHQKGVIHRDIKPSNVLVALYDDRPVPKVIDFGVAKATGQQLTDKTLATGFGAVVGTPEYMSPEQASFNNLDIDTRSDVYALGVLLYELLAGSPPFSKKELEKVGLLEIFRVIREVEPPRPSTKLSTADALPTLSANRGTEPKRLTALLRGELDWIVMKALEKDRARRYETANGFAADVQRYLAGEPVQAVPPSAGYRLKKFLKRNKGPVVVASLVALVLVGGIVGTTLGLVRAERATQAAAERAEGERKARKDAEDERDAKELARDAEARERSRAETNEKAAVEESAIAKGVGNFLQRDLLLQADTRTQVDLRWRQKGEFQIEQNPTIRELLDRAAKELTPEKIETKFPNQPRVQAEILRTVGNSYHAIGEYSKAIDHLRRSAALYERLFGPDHRDTLIALHSQAWAHSRAGQSTETIAILLRVRDTQTKTHGPTHPDTLTTLHNLGLTYLLAGKTKEGVELIQHVLHQRTQQAGKDHDSVLETLATLGEAYLDTGRTTEAIELLERVRKVWIKKPGIEHPETLVLLHNLAMAYGNDKRLDESIALYELVRDTETRTLGADHPETLATLSNLANALLKADQTTKAIEYYERAWEAQKKKPGANHLHTLQTQINLGYAYRKAGKLNEGLTLSEDALNRMRVHVGPDHPQTMIAVEALAIAYRSAKRLDKSLPLQEELLKLRKAKFGPDHDKVLESLKGLSDGYYSVRRLDRAVPLMEETLALQKVKLGPDHVSILATMNNLGESYRAIGKVDKALPLLEEGYTRTKAKFGPEHEKTITSLGNLGLAYLSDGKLERAVPILEECVELERKRFGPGHPHLATSVNNLAGAYYHTAQFDRAATLFEEALRLDKATLGPGHPQVLSVTYSLAKTYLKAGQAGKAKPLIEAFFAAERKAPGTPTARYVGLLAQVSLDLLDAREFAAAEPYLRECLTSREKTMPDSWLTFNTRSMLGGSLLGQKKYAEAEPLLLASYEGMKKREATIPPVAKIRLPEAVDRLVELYTALDKPDDVKKWQAERAKYPFVAPPPREVKR